MINLKNRKNSETEKAVSFLREKMEKPISKVYPVIDSDLARDNLENDIPAADLQDL